MVRYIIAAGIGAVVAYGLLILTATPAFRVAGRHGVTRDMVQAFAKSDETIVRDLMKFAASKDLN